MALLSGVLDNLIDTHVVDTGDLAQITGATMRSVGRWAATKAMPRRDAEPVKTFETKSQDFFCRSLWTVGL
ncbi:MAG: hypothetical protein ACYDH5_18070, partial [Acidimicrobiales bacterium]